MSAFGVDRDTFFCGYVRRDATGAAAGDPGGIYLNDYGGGGDGDHFASGGYGCAASNGTSSATRKQALIFTVGVVANGKYFANGAGA